MKALLLYTLISSIVFSSLAQNNPKISYLVVRLEPKPDYFHKKEFVAINAEKGNPVATDLYNLMPYDPDHGPGTAFSFYSKAKDTAAAYYNYFTNTTEALLFLSAKGWQILSIFDEIKSGETLARTTSGTYSVPIATVTSTPVHYLKKKQCNNK